MKKLHHFLVGKLSIATALFLLLALMPQWRLMAGGGFVSLDVQLQYLSVYPIQVQNHPYQAHAMGNLNPAYYQVNTPRGIVNQDLAAEIQSRNVETLTVVDILLNPTQANFVNDNVLDADLAAAYEAKGWGSDNLDDLNDNMQPRNKLNYALDINYNPAPRSIGSIVLNEVKSQVTNLDEGYFNPAQVNDVQILTGNNVTWQAVSVPQLQLADNVLRGEISILAASPDNVLDEEVVPLEAAYDNVLEEEVGPLEAVYDNVLEEEMAPSAAAAEDGSAEKQAEVAPLSEMRLVAFPNPTYGRFKAVLDGGSGEKVRFRITSLNGQVIQFGEVEAGSLEFDLSGRAAGVYSLQVLQGKQTRSAEILLRR